MINFVNQQVIPYGPCPSNNEDMLKLIELAGRTAYKSEEKITKDSAIKFVQMLMKHNHLSVLEHSNICLEIKIDYRFTLENFVHDILSLLKDRIFFHRNLAIIDDTKSDHRFILSGNLRTWIESLEYIKKNDGIYNFLIIELNKHYPELFTYTDGRSYLHEYQISTKSLNIKEQLELSNELPIFCFKIITDRGVSHEFVRHRVLSFTQESQRYVTYNSGLTLINRDHNTELDIKLFNDIYDQYCNKLNNNIKQQIARDILPNQTKTELFVSGRFSHWQHFLSLRDSSSAHPYIQEIAKDIKKYFIELKLL